VSYASAAADWANVMLPVAPFTETSGTFVNLAGTVQSFKGTVRPLGETRPAWKVLRVLGNLLQLQGFDEESSEAVRDAALGSVAERLSNTVTGELALTPAAAGEGLARITDVPIYFSDAITRRATSLQAAPASRAPRARLNPAEATRLGLGADDRVRVRSAAGSVELGVALDAAVPEGAVRIAGAHPGTVALGSAFGNVTVERV